MDDKKKYYEEKAKELLNFNMMAKQSKMSDNLHKMARGEAIMLECLAHSDKGEYCINRHRLGCSKG